MQPVIDFLSLNLFLGCHGLAPSGAEPRPPWNSGGSWGWRRRKEEGERGAGERWGLKHRWDSVTVILSQAGDCKHPFSNSSCSPCVAEKRK